MIDTNVENSVRDFAMQMQYQGIDLNQYMQMTGLTVDGFKEQFKDQAAEQVKMNLALEAIAKAENIEVSDDDFNAEMSKMAESYGMEVDKLMPLVGENEKENLIKDLKMRKAVEFVSSQAKEKKSAAKKTAAKKADDAKEGEEAPKKPAAKKTTTAKKTTSTTAKKTTTTKKTTTKKSETEEK